MSMETKHGPGHDPHGTPHEGYEHSDANPRSLSKWALALFIVLVVVFVAMRWLFFFCRAWAGPLRHSKTRGCCRRSRDCRPTLMPTCTRTALSS